MEYKQENISCIQIDVQYCKYIIFRTQIIVIFSSKHKCLIYHKILEKRWRILSRGFCVRIVHYIRMIYLYINGFKEYLSVYEPRCFSMSNSEHNYQNFSSAIFCTFCSNYLLINFIYNNLFEKSSYSDSNIFTLQVPQSVLHFLEWQSM